MPNKPLPEFDGSLTLKASAWVKSSAERLVLIYGEFDPWTAGALDTPSKPSSGRYIVPGGSHSAEIVQLPTKERDRASASLAAMYDLSARAANYQLASSIANSHEALMLHEHAQLSKLRFTVAK